MVPKCLACTYYVPNEITDRCSRCYYISVRRYVEEEPWKQQNDNGYIEIETSL